MKQLTKIQSGIFLLGGVLMVVGAASFALQVFMPNLVRVTSWLFLIGSVLFSVIQCMQTYEGKSLVISRLKRIQNLANIFFVLSGISMVDTEYKFGARCFAAPDLYYVLFYGKWMVLMLIAALLELYTTHRISHELKKEECK